MAYISIFDTILERILKLWNTFPTHHAAFALAGVIRAVTFSGGCSGNTQGVARLLVGMTVEEAISRLSDIHCGMKNTSCPDQVAVALRKYLEEKTTA